MYVTSELSRRMDGESPTVASLSELLNRERESHQAALTQERDTQRQLRQELEQARVRKSRIIENIFDVLQYFYSKM